MAKGKWRRDPWTGLPDGKMKFMPDAYLDADGHFDPTLLLEREGYPKLIGRSDLLCCVNSIAKVGGMREDTFYDRALFKGTDPSSHFHLIPIRAEAGEKNSEGPALTYITTAESAQAGFKNYREDAKNRQRAGKRFTDVTGGPEFSP